VAIEGLVIKDFIRQLHAQLRWASRQVSNEMTKLATRQHIVDVPKSGYIQLIADSNYQAGKKQPAAEREASRLETTSSIAAAAVALVTAECIKGSATSDDGDYKIDFVFLLTIFIMLVFPWRSGSGIGAEDLLRLHRLQPQHPKMLAKKL
jgi:hypothetical protein